MAQGGQFPLSFDSSDRASLGKVLPAAEGYPWRGTGVSGAAKCRGRSRGARVEMECDSQELWKHVRPHVVALGPLTVLRRIVKHGADVEPAISSLVEKESADRMLRMLGGLDVRE